MIEVGVHEAKTNLSRLLRRVAAGEEVVIRRGRQPVARLIAVRGRGGRGLGIDRGVLTVPEDFDAELPSDILAEFER